MKVALITPTPLLKEFAVRSKYQFVLAHIYVRDQKYRHFYQKRAKAGDSIIVDNGAYEFGESVNLKDIVTTAKELQPDILVLPDVRFNREKTIALAKESLNSLSGLAKHLIGVPQGKDLDDILQCYEELHNLPIDGYGLYEEIGDVAGLGDRPNFLKYLEDHNLHTYGRYYHMLGMEEDLTKLRRIAQFSWVNGIDSCKPIVYGLNGIELTDEGTDIPYPHRPKNYFAIADTTYEATIHANIDRVLGWAKA